MPIRFEQPQPFSPVVLEAYGRTQAAGQNLPLLANLASNQARLVSGNLNASYDRDAQMQARNYDRIQQAQLQQGELTDREYDRTSRERMQARGLGAEARQTEFLADQQNQRLAFAAQAELAQQQAAAIQRQQLVALQAELQASELTKQEETYFNALKAAQTKVASDPKLSPVHRQQAVQMLLQEMLPLHQRRQLAETRRMEMQQQQMAQQVQFQADMQNLSGAQLAQKFTQKLVSFPDPVSGQPRSGWIDAKGEFQEFEQAKAEKPPKPFDAAAAQKAALDIAHREADIAFDKTANPAQWREHAQKVLERERAAIQAKQQQPTGGGSAPTPPAPPQAPTGETSQPTGDTGQPPPPPPLEPYDADKPHTPWGRQTNQMLNQQRAEIEKMPHLTRDQKMLAQGALETIRQMSARIGGVPPPDHPARAEYERLKAYVRSLTAPPNVPPAGTPPPPSQAPSASAGPWFAPRFGN